MTSVEYAFDGFRLKLAERELWKDSEMLAVPRLSFDFIVYLIEHRDRAIGRDELVAAVWGRTDVSEGYLNQVVVRARRLFGDSAGVQNYIRTVPGFGYRWVGEIRVSSVVAPDGLVVEPDTPVTAPVPVLLTEPEEFSDDDWHLADPEAVPVRRGSVRSLAGAVAIAIAVSAAGLGVWLSAPSGPKSEQTSALPANLAMAVLPFEVSGPAESGWIGLGAMDLVATRLRGGELQVAPSETVVAALQSVKRPFADGDAARMRGLLGVGVLVEGHVLKAGDDWVVALETTTIHGERRRVEARRGDAIQAAAAAADLLLASLGRRQTAPVADAVVDATQESFQQAQAALLTNQFDLARTILLGIPNNESNATEVRLRLTEVDFRTGRLDRVEDTLGSMLSDAKVLADPLHRARALTLRGNVQFRRSAFKDAEVDFTAAIDLLKGRAAPLDLCDALTRRGMVRMALRDEAGAASDFSQARLLAERAGDRLREAHVDAGYGMLRLGEGRLELALPHLDAAIDQYEAFGATERVLTLLNALTDTYSNLLRWNEAWAASERQWALREKVGDPGLAVVIANRRGRLLVAQGRLHEAETLLVDMRRGYPALRPQAARYIDDFEAELAAAKGEPARVVGAVDRALEYWPRDPAFDRYAFLVLLRQRALLQLGDAAPDRVEALLPEVSGGAISPLFLLARAEWAAQRGDDAEAGEWFDRTAQAADENAVPFIVAQVAQSHASWLLLRGQQEAASEIAGRVAIWARGDFACALLRLEVFHALAAPEAWSLALAQARALAGERLVPEALTRTPVATDRR